MNLFEIIRWWWESNVEWIRLHDPWVIPAIAIAIPASLIIRAICVLIKVWRGR